ncbi:MAG: phosphoribosylformylglycinamidine synthase [Bacteroidales bacterium]|nr:phosphoribosylformylglycinamidine synthase [Bacteroidales bacterium]
MILFFRCKVGTVIAVKSTKVIGKAEVDALNWLFSEAEEINSPTVSGLFIGPRREMVTPWSTSAVEITQNMNIEGIERIEEYFPIESKNTNYDKMLQRLYNDLSQEIFTVDKEPERIIYITNFEEYNKKEGLALSKEEIKYLENLSTKLGRPLTDSEVFGFSQVNSEHCRHKIFNGTFIIDGKVMESSLFKMIKKTSKINPNNIISAYKDNCAFLQGPMINMFHPASGSKPDFFKMSPVETVISLKAETHNFPTTVEPFNGAATGSGGEIRDRIAGGKGSFPIAGTAVYMTSYPRFTEENRKWEETVPRQWLYQTPQEILIKASNGASDFGNKFGQPLICGSLNTFEHEENEKIYGYDKVIMLAGGVGYAKKKDSLKEKPGIGDEVILLGGDNYRIGMGGGAVSSVATGEYTNSIELNAIQRSNPEMQKRAYNAIRAVAESDCNTIISVHDHGAGGHLNCLSELVEEIGGTIDISSLPVGDPTLSAKEIIGNESQERMGLVMKSKDVPELKAIALRERAPFYIIGETTGEHNFTLKNFKNGETPIDLKIEDMLGSTPKTIMEDKSVDIKFSAIPELLNIPSSTIEKYIEQLLQLESVSCKDWLTNKVDRSVTGLIACQQTTGSIQLPLNNLGVTAIGYQDKEGIATSIGHAPAVALINPAAGSRISIAEALTNIIWAPIEDGLSGISLSANWMWPCKNEGENARLYNAVKAASDFAIKLGINIPTGKDSMSMTQKYPDGEKVLSPGTLIISTIGQVKDINKIIHPNLVEKESDIIYIPFDRNSTYELGGSAFAQILNKVGSKVPDITDSVYFAKCFSTIQFLIENEMILSGHDISSGGLVTTLLESCFANTDGGLNVDLSSFPTEILFSEMPGIIIQTDRGDVYKELVKEQITFYEIGEYHTKRTLDIKLNKYSISMDIDKYRDIWYKTSYLFDKKQSGEFLAKERYNNYKFQPLQYKFPVGFTGKEIKRDKENCVAAIIREKGSNGDREMAWALYMAGFAVKDVHMTDLISGRENLEDVRMVVFVGGFSNADTLGSAKGWAGAFLYNEKAKKSIDNFYAREDTLSLGICNGCQLMAELGLITPEEKSKSPKMCHNDSHKFESGFVGVSIPKSPSILLKSLMDSKLGIWVAHGEGKFDFPKDISNYNVALKYTYNAYPANPNGSPEGIAGICSDNGRHLALMPHPERCLRPWNWPYYPKAHKKDNITPWEEIFVNGYKWCMENR